MKTIIDVQKYQGNINWKQVQSDNVDGVFLKAVSTNNKGLYIDPTFEKNYAGATANNIPCGAYFYSYATTKQQMDKELALFKKACANKEWLLPLVIDVEDNKIAKLSKSDLTNLVAYACKEIESWGVYAMIYTYTQFASSELLFDSKELRNFDVWLADYTGKKPKFSYPYSIHQYTSKGHINGIQGYVDISETSRNYPAIIRNANLRKIK